MAFASTESAKERLMSVSGYIFIICGSKNFCCKWQSSSSNTRKKYILKRYIWTFHKGGEFCQLVPGLQRQDKVMSQKTIWSSSFSPFLPVASLLPSSFHSSCFMLHLLLHFLILPYYISSMEIKGGRENKSVKPSGQFFVQPYCSV